MHNALLNNLSRNDILVTVSGPLLIIWQNQIGLPTRLEKLDHIYHTKHSSILRFT